MVRSRATAALLLATVSAFFPLKSEAGSEDSFRRGFQSLDRKRYNEAAGHMRDAIRERSAEGGEPVRISGSFLSPYLPHYYLGVALFRIGDCTGAVKEWRESERQGVIAGTSEAGTLNSLKGQCLGPLVEKARKAAEEELENAFRLDRSLREVMAGPEGREPVGGNSAFVHRVQIAEKTLAKASAKLAEGKEAEDPDSLSAARDLALLSAQQLRSLNEEATSLVAAARSKPQPQQPPAQIAAESPAPRPARTEPAAPAPAAVPSRTLPPLAQPSPAPAPGKPAEAAPPPELAKLRAAAGAFFSGDYQATLLALRHRSFADGRIAEQAALFSAAAQMSIYWLGGGRDAALLTQAQEEIHRCKRLNRFLRPPRTAFSPRFITFFESVQ